MLLLEVCGPRNEGSTAGPTMGRTRLKGGKRMKRRIALVAATFSLGIAVAGTASAPRFRDVPAGHWASAPIARVAANGVMPAKAPGAFKPDQPVTRAELAAILVRLIDHLESRGPQKLTHSPAKPHVTRVQTAALARFPRNHAAYPSLKRLVEGGYVVPNIHGEQFLPTRETIDRPVTAREVETALAGVTIRVLEKRVGVEHPESLTEGLRLGPDDVRRTVPRGQKPPAHDHDHGPGRP